jgi:hypothetical protein
MTRNKKAVGGSYNTRSRAKQIQHDSKESITAIKSRAASSSSSRMNTRNKINGSRNVGVQDNGSKEKITPDIGSKEKFTPDNGSKEKFTPDIGSKETSIRRSSRVKQPVKRYARRQ